MKSDHAPIAGLLRRLNGVDISLYDDSFLNRSLQRRAEETHCETMDRYGTLLEKSSAERERFMDSLQIHYSEFFRNPLTFAVLEHIVLPEIVRQKIGTKQKEIRIWSAACAGGQEAYSLAILLEEMKSYCSEKFTYRIFATDQSELQIHSAQEGRYSASALNNLNFKRVGQWFTKQGEAYTVKRDLKEHIDFSQFDLFDDNLSSPAESIFGDFDIIICANLLFYYKKEFQEVILDKIKNSLASGGYLITGETEREIVKKNNFSEVFPQSAIFRNDNRRKVL